MRLLKVININPVDIERVISWADRPVAAGGRHANQDWTAIPFCHCNRLRV